ncbi:hypothetical protein WMF45_08835 [Sorangium sp. So ce448]|uniref:hypothetical protein n=1 Tax=Sorangium sp. So ce448 TaxID=3133314 RepID=UPI003F61B397
MRIAVIGDSILWGQGLRPEEKIAARVAAVLSDRPGTPSVEVRSFAHSGADVWNDGEGDIDIILPIPRRLGPMDGVPSADLRNVQVPCPEPAEREELGEIPREVPYTLNQVDRAALELAATPPDVVLLDAGINDVNVTNIVLPFKSRRALKERTRSMGDRVRCLLEHVHAAFPSSRIVLTGYYQIVTEHSDVAALIRYAAGLLTHFEEWWRPEYNVSASATAVFAAATLLENKRELLAAEVGPAAILSSGVERVRAIGPQVSLGDLLIEPLRAKLVGLSRVFAETAEHVLREQVEAFNALPGRRASLALPSIPPQHAIQTADPWLFGLDDRLVPQDPLVAVRRGLCDRFGVPLHTRFLWERASVGHPNARGARAYADAILAQLV